MRHRFSIAPMMDWTDRHCRFFHRQLTARAVLYTEMVNVNAIRLGDRARHLDFHGDEHPVVLQLGGSEPQALAEAARIGADWGYDEINLNVGCPSDRVQSGRFGACLMAEPDLVARCVGAMAGAVTVPVTVKCRIGIDDQDPEETLPAFLNSVQEAGCAHVIVHARKAWLKGLSPKENRHIPPLDYPLVHRMKARFPGLSITLNGGLADHGEALRQLTVPAEGAPLLDGVMVGREAYQNPSFLLAVDRLYYDAPQSAAARTPRQAVERFLPYAEDQCARGVPLHAMSRHLIGLFQGLPGARAWRRHLSTQAVKPGAGPEVIATALGFIREEDGKETAA